MFDRKCSLLQGLLKMLAVLMMSLSLAACGGGSSNDTGDNGGIGNGGNGGSGNGNGNGNGNDDDDDNDDDRDKPTVSILPEHELDARESIVLSFSESIRPESLELEGTLASGFETRWSRTESDNDTLELTPTHYWPFGARTLQIAAESTAGVAVTVDHSFDVRPAFANGQAASVVIGQADFTGSDSRQGGNSAHANTLDEPLGSAAYAPEQDILFIPDTWDSRVLGFRGIPSVNNANADFVLGQPDFTSSAGEVSPQGMVSPQYITVDHGHLIVTDTEGYRVTVYDDIPEDNNALPSVVIGQPDFETRISRPPCDSRTLNHSHSHFLTESGKLMVASSWQNRVLIWNELPTENYQPADMVLGQPDMESCADVPNGPRFRHPTDLWTDEERLLVLDSEKHRLLIWNSFPEENFSEPDVIIGQSNLVNEAANDDNQDGIRDAQASARVFDYPRSMWVDSHGQLFVADMDNHRILVWYEIPRETFTPADMVIGHDDFQSTGGDVEYGENEEPASAYNFNSPTGVSVIGDRMFVTERFNHRVLIFDAQ